MPNQYNRLNGVDDEEAHIEMESVPAFAAPDAVSPVNGPSAEVDASAPVADVAGSVRAAGPAQPSPAAVAPVVVGATIDGVFANLTEKADQPPKYIDENLPNYGEVVQDVAPLQGYSGAVVLTPTTELAEVVVLGMPVGSTGSFFATMFIAWFFGVVGFLCSFMLSNTHAGRAGARAGLGLQLIHWGIYLRSFMDVYSTIDGDDDNGSGVGEPSYDDDGGNAYDDYTAPMWLSYLFIILGWFLFIHGCSLFFHVRRMVRERQLTVLAA
jgi:hypothetical protein